MRFSSRTPRRRNRDPRRLRLERLEHRRILAAFPIGAGVGAGGFVLDKSQTDVVVVDGGSATDGTLSVEESSSGDTGGLKPVGTICPAVGGAAGGIDPHELYPDEGLGLPPEMGLPEEIDPSRIPGHGCPDKEGQSIRDALGKDTSLTPERWDAATIAKVVRGGGTYRPDPWGGYDDSGPDTDGDGVSDDTDSDGDGFPDTDQDGEWGCVDTDGDGISECDEAYVEVDDGSSPDTDEDGEPEDDDPAESHFDPSVAAMGIGGGGDIGGGSGVPYVPSTAGSSPPWTDPGREPTPLPEDGRPDEVGSIAWGAAVDAVITAGYMKQPGPDPGDPDDPDDPRAGDGMITATALGYTASASGYVATPPVDDVPGNPVPPPKPQC